ETAVPVNTRGSVANSLVAYCTGITNVDPIAHDLLFERFLNPARANLPDIDLDFCSRRRDEVLNYVRRTYGEDKVALVATISTLQPKSAVRETAKAYGLPESEIKKLTALLPRRWHPDPRRRDQQTLDDVLAQVEDERQRQVLEAAFTIIGQPDHLSIHPGGIVITPGPLTDWVPLQLAPKGFLVTQYDFRDVELIGLPKIDLLGIRALTVLADTAVLIRTNHDAGFKLDEIPAADAETAVLLQQGDTIGVFQCESSGARRTLRRLRAKNVADLAVANAFFKPGPATGGMAKSFVRRYRGEEQVAFLHPALEPILGSTQGVLLFQEQVLRVATEIAGLSWQEADHLRRGMSKFRAREMAAMRLSFVTGCRRRSDFTPQQAETLWQQVMAFAGYGFNQGHATAYADISYRSAYLKTHWPAEFLCARLQGHGGFHHPAIYIAEAQRLGISVRPPHVNFSERKFSLWRLEIEQSPIFNLQSPTLFMGLGQVRDLRRRSVRAIVAEQEHGPFAGLRDLMTRVRLQAKELLHLVQCGAVDGLGESRAAMITEAERVARAGSVAQMVFDFVGETAVLPETLSDRLAWETHLLGWPVSANPVALVADETADDVPLRFLPRLLNQKTTVAGVRLPGWTGGSGFYLGDGDSFVMARLDKRAAFDGKLQPWQPLRLTGFWRQDEWGGGWFAAEAVELLLP
ncbi:MAG: DNA polymerase III subunit alpha, partial [Anaerolineae bacterium]